jgi:GH15 family glucan-1,4-alpha-glucosidase
MALWALYTLGFDWEANDFFYFITDVAEASGGRLQVMYGVDGRANLEEKTLDHLCGYDGARPVRSGNAAYLQTQHDVWGGVIGSIYLYVRKRDRLDDRLWSIIVKQVEVALERWRGPDHGMWEVRGEPRHFTSSKVFCWMAAHRGAQLALIRGDTERAMEWQEAADEIHSDILANAVDERGVFVQHYDSTALDASVLLIPLVGFLPPDDPRVRGTVEAIERELLWEGFVLRYKAHDGLPPGEGVFLPCSFWLADCYELLGRHDDAHALFERLVSLRNDLGLLAEEYDPIAQRQLGNFPQAFTHLALVNTAFNVLPHLPATTHRRHGRGESRSRR